MARPPGFEGPDGCFCPHHPSLGSKLIYACLCKLMDTIGFQNVLWDSMPSNTSLNDLVEDWNSHLSVATDEVASQCPLCSHTASFPGIL